MRRTKKGTRGAVAGLVLGLGLLLGAAGPTAAQGVGSNVEAIMRARERLSLTEDQIARLDAIRREVVSARAAERAQLDELRSQLSAGQIRRSQLMAAQENQADAARARAEDVRNRVNAILTEEQRTQLQQQMRPRASRARGAGLAPRAGFRPGRFGPGPRARGFGF